MARLRILFVDDDPFCRMIFEKTVGRMFTVTVADSVRSAVETIREVGLTNFDIIVSDYEMPGGNGIKLLREVHRDEPRFPFVFITSRPEAYATEVVNAGAYSCMRKGTPIHAICRDIEKAATSGPGRRFAFAG